MHHNRPGGRVVELIVMAISLTTSGVLVLGPIIFVGSQMFFDIQADVKGGRNQGQTYVLLMVVGVAIGWWIAVRIWRLVLRYYRYDEELRPIIEETPCDSS